MGSRRQKENLAGIKARDAGRKKEFEEKMKKRESYGMKKPTSDDDSRPASAVSDRLAQMQKQRRKEVERKKAQNEKLKQRAPISTGSSDNSPVEKSRVTERQKKPKIGTLDYQPRGASLADLRRKNIEMKREREAKIAAKTPVYSRSRQKETERPTTAGPSRPTQMVCAQRPNTTGRPVTARQSDPNEVSRLKQEVANLKQKIAEMRKHPEPQYTSSQDNLTDATFENTRNLLETAYKSFGQIEAMCPNFLNDDVKRAAKVLIGLAAGFVPGSPYHDMYKRAQENRYQPEGDQIVLRPGDIDPRATTLVQVVRDNCETESETAETTVKVVKAKHAPYSSRNYTSLADVEEEITIPASEDDDDEITGELRHILETARPPVDWGAFEINDILGTLPQKREVQREYGHGRPFSPLRDFAAEENSLICLDKKAPYPERNKHNKNERREEIEKRAKRQMARLKREAWQRAGMKLDQDEYECNESALEDLVEPPEDDLCVCLGPYGEELVKNVLPRSKYARTLGLSSDGEGADLCLGDPY